MRVLVGGSSGLIGSALVARLVADGHDVTRLVRPGSPRQEWARAWDPDAGIFNPAILEGIDAVVHLGGATLASVWTKRRKEQIRNSRVRSTRFLAEQIAARLERPAVFVHASAIGIYGDRGDEVLTESSRPGTGFLADLCRDWEAASMPAQDAAIRVVRVRTAPVLSARGGFLQAMLPAFRLGIGGRLGSGDQWMPWIAIDDVVAVYVQALTDRSLLGAVNAAAPEQVTNAQFTRALGRTLRRPTLFPVPTSLLKLLPGEMAKEAFLASERVLPEVLLRSGFEFRQPALEPALRSIV